MYAVCCMLYLILAFMAVDNGPSTMDFYKYISALKFDLAYGDSFTGTSINPSFLYSVNAGVSF